ncbi:MAG: transporter [Alistipes sp.]|jgi:Tol biopolymer transport system component|nr:transporter [Alistipes sp.]
MTKKTNLLTVALVATLALTATTATLAQNQNRPKITSRLEIYDTATGERTLLKEYPYSIEAPNWTMDGNYLVYNSGGKIYKIEVSNPAGDTQVYTGAIAGSNNDHVLSFDGMGLAISASSAEVRGSRIYTLPIDGGTPRLVTPLAPSYLHGWSPDGKTLAYCAGRGDNMDVYTIPVRGGDEVRLTDAEGLDDGPEYSPDGRHIWFNSVRSGLMQVWRMNADGSQQTQMTLDETRNSWFPHVSPDGQKVLFIAYAKGDVEPGAHPGGKNVELRLMSASGGDAETVVKLFGGQGSLNVNSWAPDSRRFAFVSYIWE